MDLLLGDDCLLSEGRRGRTLTHTWIFVLRSFLLLSWGDELWIFLLGEVKGLEFLLLEFLLVLLLLVLVLVFVLVLLMAFKLRLEYGLRLLLRLSTTGVAAVMFLSGLVAGGDNDLPASLPVL